MIKGGGEKKGALSWPGKQEDSGNPASCSSFMERAWEDFQGKASGAGGAKAQETPLAWDSLLSERPPSNSLSENSGRNLNGRERGAPRLVSLSLFPLPKRLQDGKRVSWFISNGERIDATVRNAEGRDRTLKTYFHGN